MDERTVRPGASGVRAVMLAFTLIIVLPYRVHAADEIEKAHAEAGRQWYDKYCQPCHGAGGAPGTAVFKETGKPVDLRDYVKRNGGKFPTSRWITVVATDNPALLHTAVWQTIKNDQSGISADAAGRSVVASIASYVRAIQRK